MSRRIDRRTVLRGVLQGAAITVGIPMLECFLDSSGTALADGAPLPIRFGTWFWGLGLNKTYSTPATFGSGYEVVGELEPLAPVKSHINLFNNYLATTDGRPNFVHHTGAVILRCGEAPVDRLQVADSESLDVTIADAIGGASRFQSLDAAATGNRNHSYSFRNANAVNPPEISPLELYQRVFGAEFQDPNSPVFHPNPTLMLRQSVLSAVREDSARLQKSVSNADKARLDEYFTSLRSLEQRLALQLQKPPPAPACRVPKSPGEVANGMDWELVGKRHNLMTDILVAALACNQTRVFNMVYSWSAAETVKTGVPSTHHILTHEESRNDHGYQETHAWFVHHAMEAWAYFVTALASVREGDRTLLDNTLVFAHSEQDTAQFHSIDRIPMMTAGRAGGRIRSGIHLDGKDKVVTQVGLTLLQAMGANVRQWGSGSMRTSEVVSDVLV
jgi:hypothetical protein